MRSTQVNFKHVARIDEMVRSDLLCIFLHLHTPDFSNGCLVGGFNPSEKYEFVSWDHYSQPLGKKNVNHQPDKTSWNHQPAWYFCLKIEYLIPNQPDFFHMSIATPSTPLCASGARRGACWSCAPRAWRWVRVDGSAQGPLRRLFDDVLGSLPWEKVGKVLESPGKSLESHGKT